MWASLFGKEANPTTKWVMDRLLLGLKYKDPLTRFRLVLIFLVDGIICPTSGTTNIRQEVVEMVGMSRHF